MKKGVDFKRREIDIMGRQEQFEPGYFTPNSCPLVPTPVICDEVTVDTIQIFDRVPEMNVPDLPGHRGTQIWQRDIVALHYGVLLFRGRFGPDGTPPQIVARGRFLGERSRTLRSEPCSPAICAPVVSLRRH